MPRAETTDVGVTPLDLSIAKGARVFGRVFEVKCSQYTLLASLPCAFVIHWELVRVSA